MALDLHRDGPGPPRMVSDREGYRERIGGRPVATRRIAASVTVTASSIFDGIPHDCWSRTVVLGDLDTDRANHQSMKNLAGSKRMHTRHYLCCLL